MYGDIHFNSDPWRDTFADMLCLALIIIVVIMFVKVVQITAKF